MKILFVCWGNICRSVMAECIMEYLDKDNLYYIDSCGTSNEEYGNPIYIHAKHKLEDEGIPIKKHFARQFNINDYNKFDLIICMEQIHKDILLSRVDDIDNKIKLLSDYNHDIGIIDDPWYTGNFSKTYDQLYRGIESLIKSIGGE